MKKILAIVLAVVMLLPVFAVNVFAETVYDPATTFGIYVGGWGNVGTVNVNKPGTYTVTATKIDGNDWVMLKSTTDDMLSSIPEGTLIRTTEVKLNGTVMTFDGGSDHFDYTVGKDGKIEIKYYLTPNFGGTDHFDNRPAAIESAEITFEVISAETAESFAPVFSGVSDGGIKTVNENGSITIAKDGGGHVDSNFYLTADKKSYKAGDVVTVHISGNAEGYFRPYLVNSSNNADFNSVVVTGEENILIEGNASEYKRNWQGYPNVGGGDFDVTLTFTVADGKTANAICFRNPSDGAGGSYTINVCEDVTKTEEEPQDVVVYEYEPNFESAGNWASAPVLSADPKNGVPSPAELQAALAKEGAVLEVAVANASEDVQIVLQHGDGWTWTKFIDEKVSGDKTFTIPVALLTAKEIDLTKIQAFCVNSKNPFTLVSIRVIIPAPKEVARRLPANFAFVYINEEFHAYSFRDLFIPMPHVDNGAGFCTFCREAVPTDVEEGDKSVFVLEKTGGQDFEVDATIADGVVLVDVTEGADNARIATNWKSNGTAWNGIVKAVATEGAWLKITYTGKLNSVIFQTANNAAPEEFEITEPAVVEEGEQNVAWFNCADIVANSPNGLSGADGWANFMLNFEGETTVYGFEVVIPEVVPVAE